MRKGHVGAGLPFEPWNTLPDGDLSVSSRSSPFSSSTASPMCTDSSSEFSSPQSSTTKPCIPLTTPTNYDPQFDLTFPNVSFDQTSKVVSSRPVSSSLTSPPHQPLLPSQIVALGSLVEDLEINPTKSRSSSPLLPPLPIFDEVVHPPLSPANTMLTITDADSQASLQDTFPNVEIKMASETQMKSNIVDLEEKNSKHIQDSIENSNTDSLSGRGPSLNPLDQFVKYDDQLNFGSFELFDGQNDLSVGHEPTIHFQEFKRESRWSVDTEESLFDYPTPSSTFAGPFPLDPIGSVSGNFGHWNSTSDADYIAGLSHCVSLSCSISSTSVPSFSLDDPNSCDFRRLCQASNARDGRRSADDSQSSSDHSLPRLSHSATLSSSESNSLLHSPDLEWTSFGQQQCHPAIAGEVDWISGNAEADDLALSDGVMVATPSQISTEAAHCQGDVHNPSGCFVLEPQRNIGDSDVTESDLPATAHDSAITSSTAAHPPDFSESTHTPSLSIVDLPLIPLTASDNHFSSVVPVDTQRPLHASLSRVSSSLNSTMQYSNIDRHEMATGLDTTRANARHSGGKTVHRANEANPHMPGSVSDTNKQVSDVNEPRGNVILGQMRRDFDFQLSLHVNDDVERKNQNLSTELRSISSSRSVSRSFFSARSTCSKEQQLPMSSSMSPTSTSDEEASSSSDDNIPLAQRIPNALTAQQTIRRQVEEEKEARKAEKERKQREGQLARYPRGAETKAVVSTSISSPQETTPSKSAAHSAYTSTITKDATLTSRQPISRPQRRPSVPDVSQAFNPEDLTKKLQSVKTMDESSTMTMQHATVKLQIPHRSATILHPESRSRVPQDQSLSAIEPMLSASPLLGTSLHRQISERSPQEAMKPQDQVRIGGRSMSVARGDREKNRREHGNDIPPLPFGRTSVDDRGRRVLVKQRPDLGLHSSKSTRVSAEGERHSQRSVNRPSTGGFDATATYKQPIFIHSLQHHRTADIGPTTNAGELIASWEAEGILDGWAGLGGWMIWEVAQDFGMGEQYSGIF